MKAAGSVEPAKYQAAMKGLKFQGVSGPVAFDANGDIVGGTVTVYNFKSGKWEPTQTIQ